MPISSGAYVAPAWANGTSPYINATELSAMSTTLACVPIANGGTGATTAANALTNLGALAKSNVVSKGTTNTPVYFNSNGVATAISQPIPISLGGTGQTNSTTENIDDAGGLENCYVRAWGKIVMIYLTTSTISSTGTGVQVYGFIPSGYRPSNQVFGVAVGLSSRNLSGAVKNWASVKISTSGDVIIEPNPRVDASCHYAVNICYVR